MSASDHMIDRMPRVLRGPAMRALAALLCIFLFCDPASAADAPPRFDIAEIRVLGNSVLANIDIERAVYPHTGPDRSLEDVEAARLALETAYHERGFGTVFVDIPEQDVADGIVRLRVTEGRLDHVAVGGARYFSNRDVREAVPAAERGVVPDLKALQQQVGRVNALSSDRAVVPVLKAGAAPGTVDLALKVDDHLPLHAALEVNNQATPDTSSLRTAMTLSYGDVFGRFDEASLQYQTSPQHTREVGVLALTYAAHVTGTDGKLSFLFVNSNSDVATVGALAVLGAGQIYGVRWVQPMGVARNASQVLTLGLDYKSFSQAVQLDPTTQFKTPINYAVLSATYAGGAQFEHGALSASASANLGVRHFVNDEQTFADKRFLARPNFFFLRSDVSYLRHLPKDFSLTLRLAGQAAAEPVIGNEQFGIGGADGVRGYLEAEHLGDLAIKGTVQVGAPPLQWAEGAWSLDGFAFVDAARAGTLQSLPGEASSVGLSSWGLGFSLQATRAVSANMTWARPVVAGPRTAAGDGRILFVVRGVW